MWMHPRCIGGSINDLGYFLMTPWHDVISTCQMCVWIYQQGMNYWKWNFGNQQSRYDVHVDFIRRAEQSTSWVSLHDGVMDMWNATVLESKGKLVFSLRLSFASKITRCAVARALVHSRGRWSRIPAEPADADDPMDGGDPPAPHSGTRGLHLHHRGLGLFRPRYRPDRGHHLLRVLGRLDLLLPRRPLLLSGQWAQIFPPWIIHERFDHPLFTTWHSLWTQIVPLRWLMSKFLFFIPLWILISILISPTIRSSLD